MSNVDYKNAAFILSKFCIEIKAERLRVDVSLFNTSTSFQDATNRFKKSIEKYLLSDSNSISGDVIDILIKDLILIKSVWINSHVNPYINRIGLTPKNTTNYE